MRAARLGPLAAAALIGAAASTTAQQPLWLERADLSVSLSPERHEVVQRMRVGVSAGSGASGRIEHTLALGKGDVLSAASVTSPSARVELEWAPSPVLSRLWVRWEGGRADEADLSYELRFAIEPGANGFRCPLAVPRLPPRDSHGAARLRVRLAGGRQLAGLSFPRLRPAGGAWGATMGGVPAFVHVPQGSSGVSSWLARHGADLLVLLLVGGGTWAWLRLRASE